jgi:hypothetical protein
MGQKGTYMSVQKLGFYFSANADGSANDRTIYVEGDSQSVLLTARYKNAEPSGLYTIELDAADLARFGRLCLALAGEMQRSEATA